MANAECVSKKADYFLSAFFLKKSLGRLKVFLVGRMWGFIGPVCNLFTLFISLLPAGQLGSSSKVASLRVVQSAFFVRSGWVSRYGTEKLLLL